MRKMIGDTHKKQTSIKYYTCTHNSSPVNKMVNNENNPT